MGQQQSAEKAERLEKGRRIESDREKRANGRVSIPPMSHGRSSPATPSASNASATAQTIHQNVPKSNLLQHLPSTSPDVSAKNKVERTSSRGSSNRKREGEQPRSAEATPMAVPVPTPSGPMDVPSNSKGKQDDFEDQSTYHQNHYAPVSSLRPPRLPLPIAGVVPDSPTLHPVDKGNEDVSILESDEPMSAVSQTLRRRDSMLSTTTQDEEEIRDELQPYAAETTGQAVPTTIHWNQLGEKVYVTGTFANWEKKYKLHHDKATGGMSATIAFPPGTHHIKFIVDGDMRYSLDMPTAVDLNNILVNYIEISPEQIGRTRRESSQKPARSVIYPAHPPLVPEEADHDTSGEDTPGEYDGTEEPQEEEIPMGDFRQLIPQYLIDMESMDDPKAQQANQIIDDTPGPPSLPLFLGRSILNGNLPMKDDSSVLTLPNHTVLNHLATSSVRNGVLATSVTTRYKKKYVTTIMYKPVPTHRTTEN